MDPWREIAQFQIQVAARWLDVTERVRGEHALEFVACFSALNALYWLWGKIDALRTLRREVDVLDSLLTKFTEDEAVMILEKPDVKACRGLLSRRPPIRDMKMRSIFDSVGPIDMGQKLRDRLLTAATGLDKVRALGRILYLVRCNLVHGSKNISDNVDDELLRHCLSPLRLIVKRALVNTDEAFSEAPQGTKPWE